MDDLYQPKNYFTLKSLLANHKRNYEFIDLFLENFDDLYFEIQKYENVTRRKEFEFINICLRLDFKDHNFYKSNKHTSYKYLLNITHIDKNAAAPVYSLLQSSNDRCVKNTDKGFDKYIPINNQTFDMYFESKFDSWYEAEYNIWTSIKYLLINTELSFYHDLLLYNIVDFISGLNRINNTQIHINQIRNLIRKSEFVDKKHFRNSSQSS